MKIPAPPCCSANERDGRVNLEACQAREKIQAPPREGRQADPPSTGQEDPRQPVLSAPFGACGDGHLPEGVWEGHERRVLVVLQRGATVPAPSLHKARAWTEQRRRLWKDVGEACEWKHPRTPSVRLL